MNWEHDYFYDKTMRIHQQANKDILSIARHFIEVDDDERHGDLFGL